jgi:citrate synthase
MSQQRGKTTRLSGYDESNILIRDKNLVSDLMGKLSFTQMLLFHITGETPTPLQLTVTDAVLVTIMEHGLVPSAIASRLTLLGAPESFQGAVAAGLLGVGDRYAGTASECGALLEKIVAADDRESQACAIVREYRADRRPLPGFGHPVHRHADPRVPRLVEIAESAGAKGDYIAAMRLLESSLEEELGKKLPVNVSAAIAAVLGEAGVPRKVFRGIVLTARCAGLVGHLLEEMESPAADAMWKLVEEGIPFEGGSTGGKQGSS